MSKKYCLTLNLKNDQSLIQQYEEHHKNVWPEIIGSIKRSGIERMEIYRLGLRLFMTMETADDFSFEAKDMLDKSNVEVQAWEELMWKYQDSLPEASNGEKWMLMNKIFDLNNF